MFFGNRVGRRMVSQGWRIWCECTKTDRENECRRVVGQGGTIWLKWIPYEGLITCNGKVIGCYGLDRIPIGDTNRLNIIFSR